MARSLRNPLENDGALEAAQRIAGHADSRTTKPYDRRGQKVLLEETILLVDDNYIHRSVVDLKQFSRVPVHLMVRSRPIDTLR